LKESRPILRAMLSIRNFPVNNRLKGAADHSAQRLPDRRAQHPRVSGK
jgi:hypothetical protein